MEQFQDFRPIKNPSNISQFSRRQIVVYNLGMKYSLVN